MSEAFGQTRGMRILSQTVGSQDKTMAPTPEILRIQRQIAEVVGAETFNRLVDSVPATREARRLRFWQEELLDDIAAQTNIDLTNLQAFLRVFEGAERCHIPRGPWTREIFLHGIEEWPLGGIPLDETPPSWMADAWLIDSVREAISDEFARNVSKTGSLCYTDEYLDFLQRALTVEQLVELFLYIRDEQGCGSREAEFRPEFEQAFPKCVAALPPPLPPDPAEIDPRMYGPGEIYGSPDDIPF
jgi:hypothetical protein